MRGSSKRDMISTCVMRGGVKRDDIYVCNWGDVKRDIINTCVMWDGVKGRTLVWTHPPIQCVMNKYSVLIYRMGGPD